MDAQRFDALARLLAVAGSRRQLLAGLAAVPVLQRLDPGAPEVALAKDRRRRRKQRHNRRKNPGNRKGGGCQRKSIEKICEGRCGLVKNRKSCGKTVDCTAVCTGAGSTCCGDACQTQAQLNAACPSGGTPGFLTLADDSLRCASPDVAACTCLGGVYRACAPGTFCRPFESSIVCDFPDSQAPE